MADPLEQKQTISTYHLQQHKLVDFLYDRFNVGMVFTLVVAFVASALTMVELELQGREHWVAVWLILLIVIQLLRLRLKKAYDRIRHDDYMSHETWKRRFIIGVYLVALCQGIGGMLVMPYVSSNLQFILHTFLLGLGAGAIAYLSTSMVIYGAYLVLMIAPVTVYLFRLGTPDSLVLAFMYTFMIFAYYFGVRRMNSMITEAMSLRFENEMLVNDLQRLLSAVAKSNKELDEMSTTDELTGVSNYRAFRVRLEEFRRKYMDTGLPLSIAMLNVDFYYEYNEFYGQELGNKTLTELASLMQSEVIQEDGVVARITGAEFGLLFPGVSCEGARLQMEKVIQALRQKAIQHEKSRISPLLTVSVGICCVPVSENLSSRNLISKAEEALRLAKSNGRNRIELANS